MTKLTKKCLSISLLAYLSLFISACQTTTIEPADFPTISKEDPINIVIRSVKDDTFNTNDYHYFKKVVTSLFENEEYPGSINFYQDGQKFDRSIPSLEITISKWYLYQDKFQCLLYANIRADGKKTSIGASKGEDDNTLYNLSKDIRDGKAEAAYIALLPLYDKFLTYTK